jgi:(p)ppGpp synthase/HD superfamily hydrolase
MIEIKKIEWNKTGYNIFALSDKGNISVSTGKNVSKEEIEEIIVKLYEAIEVKEVPTEINELVDTTLNEEAINEIKTRIENKKETKEEEVLDD